MGTVDNQSPIKPRFYGDSASGEVSYVDLQRNTFIDFRERKRAPVQVGDFQDPTNFIRNQISQTLHMRPGERPPAPIPRRTYDSGKKGKERGEIDQRNTTYSIDPLMSTPQSPDVTSLRSHINIGGTSVKLRNPQRLSSSSSRKGKTMSWMEQPARKTSSSCSDQRRHSNITDNEKYLKTLKKMEERRILIETDRMRHIDRRDYIENEKRLKEDLWSDELVNLQKELDAFSVNDQTDITNSVPSVLPGHSPVSSKDAAKIILVSENNNNNKRTNVCEDPKDSTFISNSHRPILVQSQNFASPSQSRDTKVDERYVKSAAHAKKSLLFKENDHKMQASNSITLKSSSDAALDDTISSRLEENHEKIQRPAHAYIDSPSVNGRAKWTTKNQQTVTPMTEEQKHQKFKPRDALAPSVKTNEISSAQSKSMSSELTLSGHPHDRLTTFNLSRPATQNPSTIPIVSPSKENSKVEIVVTSPKATKLDVSGIVPMEDNGTGVSSVRSHERENCDPNHTAAGNLVPSTYDSFAYKFTENGSNQSTPYKSGSLQLDESSPEKSPSHGDSSFLTKTADRNRRGGEGFELVDDATPNTLLAKKKEMFLLKQLKKEEEMKRKRAEREQDEERKKEEARIKQEEINAKREEEKLKRQQILDEYKKRKMEQEENQRIRETGDIIANTKKNQKSLTSKGSHATRKGYPYAASLAGSISNVSEVGTGFQSDLGSKSPSLKSIPGHIKRLSTNSRLDWETESALSSAVSSEYNGPKLYKEPSLKSNKHIVYNAICHCCLPGKVNEATRQRILQILDVSEARHFMILFRDSKCQFRALYTYDPDSEKLFKLDGNGPSTISPSMIDCLYKYNSGRKSFASLPSKTLSVSIDAVTIKNSLWQTSKRGKTHKK